MGQNRDAANTAQAHARSSGRREKLRSKRRPFTATVTRFATVRQRNGWLVVTSSRPSSDSPVAVREPGRLLERFIDLAEASDEKIHSFAKAWGLLGLCERHELPLSHHGVDRPGRLEIRMGPDRTVNTEDGPRVRAQLLGVAFRIEVPHREPTRAWRRFAVLARSTQAVASAVRGSASQPFPADAWYQLSLLRRATLARHTALQRDETRRQLTYARGLEHDALGGRAARGASPVDVRLPGVVEARRTVAGVIATWLRLGRASMSCRWDGEEPQPAFVLGGDPPFSLFALLGIELLASVGSAGSRACERCGKPHLPARSPQAGAPNYCEPCRRGRVNRERVAAWRAAQLSAEKRELGEQDRELLERAARLCVRNGAAAAVWRAAAAAERSAVKAERATR